MSGSRVLLNHVMIISQLGRVSFNLHFVNPRASRNSKEKIIHELTTMPTTGPEQGHQNGEMSLENLFDDDDDAEMMLIDSPNTDHKPNATAYNPQDSNC